MITGKNPHWIGTILVNEFTTEEAEIAQVQVMADEWKAMLRAMPAADLVGQRLEIWRSEAME